MQRSTDIGQWHQWRQQTLAAAIGGNLGAWKSYKTNRYQGPDRQVDIDAAFLEQLAKAEDLSKSSYDMLACAAEYFMRKDGKQKFNNFIDKLFEMLVVGDSSLISPCTKIIAFRVLVSLKKCLTIQQKENLHFNATYFISQVKKLQKRKDLIGDPIFKIILMHYNIAMGHLYLNGLRSGVVGTILLNRAPVKAMNFFKRAENEDPEAALQLAKVYEHGIMVPSSSYRYLLKPQPERVKDLLTQAANLGSKHAQSDLAQHYWHGLKYGSWAIQPQPEKVEALLQAAAAQGLAIAQHRLAYLYWYGLRKNPYEKSQLVVKPQPEKAKPLAKAAAEKGCEFAIRLWEDISSPPSENISLSKVVTPQESKTVPVTKESKEPKEVQIPISRESLPKHNPPQRVNRNSTNPQNEADALKQALAFRDNQITSLKNENQLLRTELAKCKEILLDRQQLFQKRVSGITQLLSNNSSNITSAPFTSQPPFRETVPSVASNSTQNRAAAIPLRPTFRKQTAQTSTQQIQSPLREEFLKYFFKAACDGDSEAWDNFKLNFTESDERTINFLYLLPDNLGECPYSILLFISKSNSLYFSQKKTAGFVGKLYTRFKEGSLLKRGETLFLLADLNQKNCLNDFQKKKLANLIKLIPSLESSYQNPDLNVERSERYFLHARHIIYKFGLRTMSRIFSPSKGWLLQPQPEKIPDVLNALINRKDKDAKKYLEYYQKHGLKNASGDGWVIKPKNLAHDVVQISQSENKSTSVVAPEPLDEHIQPKIISSSPLFMPKNPTVRQKRKNPPKESSLPPKTQKRAKPNAVPPQSFFNTITVKQEKVASAPHVTANPILPLDEKKLLEVRETPREGNNVVSEVYEIQGGEYELQGFTQ